MFINTKKWSGNGIFGKVKKKKKGKDATICILPQSGCLLATRVEYDNFDMIGIMMQDNLGVYTILSRVEFCFFFFGWLKNLVFYALKKENKT